MTEIAQYPLTKRKLLEATLKLMSDKGYSATKVDEICNEAEVTKGSFFHYFKTKEDIAKVTLEFFSITQQEKLHEAGFQLIKDPWDRIQKYLDFYVFAARSPEIPKTCLAGNLAQELSTLNHEILGLCEENFQLNAKVLKEYLDEAKVLYAAQATFNTQSLADWFISIFQGSLIMVKATRNNEIFAENVEHYRAYLSMLFNK